MKPGLADAQILAIRDLTTALDSIGLPGVLIGGVAVSLVAVPRYTGDVDALVVFDAARVTELLNALQEHGYEARFSGMAEFAAQARLVTMVHLATGTVVDLALGCMPFEEEVQVRATTYTDTDLSVRLPTPEDLIILKAIANRPKDQEDIRTIAAVYPDVDRKRIRFWVEQYAELLEEPGLWGEIEGLLG